jgi:hypothetical protein
VISEIENFFGISEENAILSDETRSVVSLIQFGVAIE